MKLFLKGLVFVVVAFMAMMMWLSYTHPMPQENDYSSITATIPDSSDNANQARELGRQFEDIQEKRAQHDAQVARDEQIREQVYAQNHH